MNKCALITGAAKRIGENIAATLHDAGFNITIHYHHSHDEALALAKQLNNKRPNSAITVAADLGDDVAQQALVTSHMNYWGQLDALINNASRFYPTPVDNATRTQWQDLMGSNIEAPFFLSQKCIAALTKTHGSIINIVDIYSQKPLAQHPIYSISKAAIAMLTKTLATELAPDIRVNGVSPGNILWPADNALDANEQQKMLEKIPLKHQGTPNDISEVVLFLINQPYMTGQLINVDGGKGLG
jgi:pteridine reductase